MAAQRVENLAEIVGLAALLHDITHIPHGHALEDEFQDLYLKHDDLRSPRLWYLLYDESSGITKAFQEETPWFDFIDNLGLRDLLFLILKYRYKVDDLQVIHEFPELMEEALADVRMRSAAKSTQPNVDWSDSLEMLEQLNSIYLRFGSGQTRLFEPFMGDIISNTLCADLIDYVARDVRNTGLLLQADPRVEKYFTVAKDSYSSQLHLTIRICSEKGPKLDITSTILDWMNLRYSLAERVYYHKTKVSADAMLGSLLRRIGSPPDRRPYSSSGSKTPLRTNWRYRNECVLSMRDSDLFEYVRDKAAARSDEDATDILEMLENRVLFKPVLILPKHLAEEPGLDVFDKLNAVFRPGPGEGPVNAQRLETALNTMFGDARSHTILFCPPRKMQAKAVESFVEVEPGHVRPLSYFIEKGGLPRPMERRLETVKDMYGYLWKLFLFLRSDDFENAVARHGVLVGFAAILREDFGIVLPLDKMQELYPSGFVTPLEAVELWYEPMKYRVVAIALAKVREVADIPRKWAELCLKYRGRANSLPQVCELIHAHVVAESYNEKGKLLRVTVPELAEILEKIEEVEVAALRKRGAENAEDLPYRRELTRLGLVA